MHAFVSAILLRMAGGDAFRHDAQLDPPHRQARQPGQRSRSKRRAVIRADGCGHAVLAKSRFKYGLHSGRVGLLYALAAQQVSAVRVGDGQRIDALPVGGWKPALESRAPHAIRSIGMRELRAVGSGAQALLAWHYQTFALQQCSNGAGPVPASTGLIALQKALELARSPAHVRLPQT